MSELDTLRREIDEIDRALLPLFLRRMEVTGQVGRYKQQVGMKILDLAREQQVLAQKVATVSTAQDKADVTTLYQSIMAISRRQQRKLVCQAASPAYQRIQAALASCRTPVEHPRVVYQGVPGAYSEEAVVQAFGEGANCAGLDRFEDVFQALADGTADYGVVPVENSSTGSIRQTFDLLASHGAYLVGEQVVRVDHCLMAPFGADLDTITHVYSHEQGLFQSDRFLDTHPHWVRVPMLDTAGSAQYVAQQGALSKAAICSRRAAQLYHLEILAEQTNHNTENYTRFVVVAPQLELPPGRNKVSASFTLPHHSGTLHQVMTIFAANGLNMVKLESRPILGRSWEYLFFVDFTGDLTHPDMAGVLQELDQATEDFRILGNYVGCELVGG